MRTNRALRVDAAECITERVRDTGTVYWQAEFAGRPAPSVIKAVVGEDWILERTPSGDLKFVLYMNTFHHTLADSAPLDL